MNTPSCPRNLPRAESASFSHILHQKRAFLPEKRLLCRYLPCFKAVFLYQYRARSIIDNNVIKGVRLEKLQRICHCHICREYKICVKFFIFRVVHAICFICPKDSLERLHRFHENRSFMNNVKQSLGIEVKNIECRQICFSGACMSQVVDKFVFDKIQSL